jgi:uncharacterized protein (TIGR03435 family)
VLTENLDRPVIDRTGLTRRYDFDLQFDPSQLVDWRLAPVIPSMLNDLGLRLEAMKTDLPTLVVDSIEHPTKN